jgi:hypothetical protein
MYRPRTKDSKKQYLFKGIQPQLISKLQLDEVAEYSVTSTYCADIMSSILLSELPKGAASCILDGMACVGGNTISFSKYFQRVVSNEFDPKRFDILQRNVRQTMQRTNVQFVHDSILHLLQQPELTTIVDALFLDPEWGGPDYINRTRIPLSISGVPVEEVCGHALSVIPLVALKVPLNYNFDTMRKYCANNNIQQSIHTHPLKKMGLILLRKLNIVDVDDSVSKSGSSI